MKIKNKTELEVEIVSAYDSRFMYQDGVDLKKYPFGFVSEALKDEILHWNDPTPIAIFSDTGTGKNTFIEEVIIPHTIRYGKTILLLSNRVALGRQTKRRLARLYGVEYILDDYTDQGLDHFTEIDNLTMVSYQQLAYWHNSNSRKVVELIKKRFDYVICDEAHFFTSDSPFNAFTDIILHYIINNFTDSVCIYMTATPDEIFPILKMKQRKDRCSCMNRNGYWLYPYDWKAYRFEHDYSHLNVFSFETMEDLAMLINESEEKWAVFVESIKDGETLCSMVKDAVLVTAESKKITNPTYNTFKMITDEERFEERVLVSTSVLENGINIKDRRLKKVAIFSNDKVRFIQMLGRIRRIDGCLLELYIPDVTEQEVRKKCNAISRINTAYRNYEASRTDFYNRYIHEDLLQTNVKNQVTILDIGEIHLNELSCIKIGLLDLKFWEDMKKQYEHGEQFPVLKEKFKWIEKTFTETCQRGLHKTAEARQYLVDFLESYVDKEIRQEQQQEFCEEISDLFRAAYGKRKEDTKEQQVYRLNIIRKRLAHHDLPYLISNKKREYWKVSKEEPSDE